MYWVPYVKILQNTQIHRIYLPILGSGHGGITRKLALFILFYTIIDFLRHSLGHHIHEVNIIIFKPDEISPPEICEKDVRNILDSIFYFSK